MIVIREIADFDLGWVWSCGFDWRRRKFGCDLWMIVVVWWLRNWNDEDKDEDDDDNGGGQI